MLGTFLYLNFIFSFPNRPVDTALVRTIAKITATGDAKRLAGFLVYVFKHLCVYGGLAGVGLALFSPFLKRFLNLQSPAPVLAAIALGYAGLVLTAFRAPMLALLRVDRYSLVLVVDAITRLVLGIALLSAGYHVWGAMFAYLGGVAVAITLCFFFVQPMMAGPVVPPPEDASGMLTYARPVFVYSFFVAFALSIDGIMAKHYFTESAAGIYMAASTLAKIMFIVVSPIASVSFSTLCNAAARGLPIMRIFFKSLTLTLAACFSAVAASIFVSSDIVSLTYGAAFADAGSLLPYTCLAFVPLGFLLILANYFFTLGRSTFLLGLAGGTGIQLLLIVWHHETGYALAVSYGVGGVLQCVLAVLFGMRK